MADVLAQLVPLVLKISIALIVCCVALRGSPGDLTYLLRRPSLLLRSVLVMNVLVPIVAAVIAGVFDLSRQVEAALILLAVSPVPPILPGKQGKAGGNMPYGIGLLTFSALIAIVAVPVSVWLIGRVFGRPVDVPMATIAKVVGESVLGPLIFGVIIRRLAPSFAERAAKPVSTGATILLVLALIPVLLKSWRAVVGEAGDSTIVAIVLFVGLGLILGHLLGGPAPEDRTVLALSAANRHPGVAMTIASAIAAPEAKPFVAAAVLLCVLVGAIVTTPYVMWRRRVAAAAS